MCCLALGCVWQVVDNSAIPQWQRRELQGRLQRLLRTTNTYVRKLETREVRAHLIASPETTGCCFDSFPIMLCSGCTDSSGSAGEEWQEAGAGGVCGCRVPVGGWNRVCMLIQDLRHT